MMLEHHLIISGPVPQGDRHEFMELKPKIQDIVNVQRKYLTRSTR